jgi:hypothetical protein
LKLRHSRYGGRGESEEAALEKFLSKAFIFDYTDLKNLENGSETEKGPPFFYSWHPINRVANL